MIQYTYTNNSALMSIYDINIIMYAKNMCYEFLIMYVCVQTMCVHSVYDCKSLSIYLGVNS